MKRTLILISFVLVLLLSACQFFQTNEVTEITVSGVDFKPNYYEVDGELVGIDADVAAAVMAKSNIEADFIIDSSWASAYQATLAGPNRALLTCAYSAERKDLFKWAGPTSKSNYNIFAKASTGIDNAIGIEACKSIASIAVVNNWNETIALEELGFNNLQYYDNYDDAINAFKNDQVQAIASDVTHFVQTVSSDYYRQENINTACIYHTAFYFIAFSIDVDDAVVNKCQEEIDAMKTDGTTYFDLYQGYISYATAPMVPSIIQLYTENDPPYNYITEIDGANITLTGSSVEIITEMQSNSSYKNPINIANWAIEYEALQYMPNYALFTTARTTAREDLFQWVGPISATKACFYTKTASGIQITSLDDAKALGSIVTPEAWFTHDFLIDNGFNNVLNTASTSEEALEQLMDGSADALFLYETGLKWLCTETNTAEADISKQFETGDYQYYIAFSQNTPASIVEEWQNNLDAMKNDGSFETIWDRWFEGVPMP